MNLVKSLLAKYVMEYTGSNEALLKYFEVRPVEIGDFMDEWREFIHDYLNDNNRAALLKHLGLNNINEVKPHDYDNIPDQAKRFFADWLVETRVALERRTRNPVNAPAWMLVEPVSYTLLPSNTRLIHFTDNADAVVAGGFKIGVPDAARIAMTWFNDIWGNPMKAAGSTGPGYNCGYEWNGYSPRAHHSAYGKEAVIFETSGILCYHHENREQQVFFWGPTINPRTVRKESRI